MNNLYDTNTILMDNSLGHFYRKIIWNYKILDKCSRIRSLVTPSHNGIV